MYHLSGPRVPHPPGYYGEIISSLSDAILEEIMGGERDGVRQVLRPTFPPVEPSPPFAVALFVIVSLVRRQLWDHYVGRRTDADDDALWKKMIPRRRVATRKQACLVSSDRAERRRISFSRKCKSDHSFCLRTTNTFHLSRLYFLNCPRLLHK